MPHVPPYGPSVATFAVAVTLVLSVTAYAMLAGADFGGGIWDLLAGGAERGEKPREAIDRSITPVWEGNHVWLIFVLVVLWTGFPEAFSAVTTSLFIPLSASLLGIILRGVGFAFRHEAQSLIGRTLTGGAFAIGSLLTPFMLGTVIGGIVTGQVKYGGPSGAGSLLSFGGFAREVSTWTNVTSVLTGVMFVIACAYVGAIYLVGDAMRRGESGMVEYFRVRAIAAGLLFGPLAGATWGTMSFTATYVYGRLTGGIALVPAIISIVAGTTALALLVLRRFSIWRLRILGAAAVMGVVAAWAWAQYPYLLPTSLSLQYGSAPGASLDAIMAVVGLTAVFVVPPFLMLYALQQRDELEESPTTKELREAVREGGLSGAPSGPPPEAAAQSGKAHRVTVALVVAAIAADAVRETLAEARARWRSVHG